MQFFIQHTFNRVYTFYLHDKALKIIIIIIIIITCIYCVVF